MSEIIKYRDFEIVRSALENWEYHHKDFGVFDLDDRYGWSPTLDECKQEIDDWYRGEENE